MIITAASRSSAVINFNAINRRQFFFVPDAIGTKMEYMAPISGACVRGFSLMLGTSVVSGL